jgi:hypothetical protein
MLRKSLLKVRYFIVSVQFIKRKSREKTDTSASMLFIKMKEKLPFLTSKD